MTLWRQPLLWTSTTIKKRCQTCHMPIRPQSSQCSPLSSHSLNIFFPWKCLCLLHYVLFHVWIRLADYLQIVSNDVSNELWWGKITCMRGLCLIKAYLVCNCSVRVSEECARGSAARWIKRHRAVHRAKHVPHAEHTNIMSALHSRIDKHVTVPRGLFHVKRALC